MKTSTPLFPGLPTKIEWEFLVNETYIGERCIVPLLQGLLKGTAIQGALRSAIELQLEEEIGHVRMFHNHVGRTRRAGTAYDQLFGNYVKALPSATLKLFAMQAILEGIALGNLTYRLSAFSESPSQADDEKALREEEGHTSASYPFFDRLRAHDKAVSKTDFAKATHELNQIFSSTFSPDGIADALKKQWGIENANSQMVANSPGMARYRQLTLRSLAMSRRAFLKHYEEVEK